MVSYKLLNWYDRVPVYVSLVGWIISRLQEFHSALTLSQKGFPRCQESKTRISKEHKTKMELLSRVEPKAKTNRNQGGRSWNEFRVADFSIFCRNTLWTPDRSNNTSRLKNCEAYTRSVHLLLTKVERFYWVKLFETHFLCGIVEEALVIVSCEFKKKTQRSDWETPFGSFGFPLGLPHIHALCIHSLFPLFLSPCLEWK